MAQTQRAFELARDKFEATDGRSASQNDIKELFEDIVQSLPGSIFVVDGLDECAEPEGVANLGHKGSLQEFLKSVTRIISNSQSRLLIVSRSDLRIREGLSIDDNETKGAVVELRISPEYVEADATLFSQSIINRKLGNKSAVQREELANRLVERCDSMFLGIKLLEDDLRGGRNLKQLQRAIDQAPNRLDHIYDRNWGRIQNLDDTSRRRAFEIMRWATFALRPLTVLEITGCLLLPDEECDELDYEELPDSIDDIYIKTEILDLCGSLIETRPGSTAGLGDSTIHLTHFSVRQYILCHMPVHPAQLVANEQLWSSNESIQSNILAKACLRYLNLDQVWKESQGELDGTHIIQAFKAYAANAWYQHLKREMGEIGDLKDVLDLVNAFFHPSNEKWQLWRRCSYDDPSSSSPYSAIFYDGELKRANPLFYAALLGLAETVNYLIEEVGMDVNHVDSSNRTALFATCWSGNVPGIARLLEKGADLRVRTRDGATALHQASYQGSIEIVQLLLENGADLDVQDNDGWTALQFASSDGSIEVVHLLLKKGADINIQNNNGWTALLIASHKGCIEIVQLLLEKGADLDIQTNNGLTALHLATDKGPEVVKLLLEKGANLDIQSNSGWTALQFASYDGSIEVVHLLLKKGADINVQNNNGWTALPTASNEGHVKVVQLLLEEGADPNIAENDGWTPLHLALQKGYVEIAKILLDNRANPNIAKSNGWTPLYLASQKDNVEIIKVLLDNGADPNIADNDGWTPLYLASQKDNVEIIKVLLDNGANPNIAKSNGWTPLHLASQDRVEIVKVLLDNGANPNMADNDGWAPLHLASQEGYVEMVKILLDNGADPNMADNGGETPLVRAIGFGLVDAVRLFLEKGHSAKSINPISGYSMVSYAAEYGHSHVVDYLLQSGADPKVSDHMNRTALFFAAVHGSVAIFDLIHSASNVSIESPDYYGSTLLSIATRHAHIELVNHLLSHDDIDMNAKDNFGRTAYFWAGTPALRQSLTVCAARRGIVLDTTNGIARARPPRSLTEMWCDVCTLVVERHEVHYHCDRCYGGNLDICKDCYVIGASCLGDTHELVERKR
jgi:ankyrin repeat protein